MYRPKIYRSIFQIRYKKKLSFFSRLSQICEKKDGFEFWEYNSASVVLRDRIQHFKIGFADGSSSFSMDSHNTSMEKEEIAKLVEDVESILQVKNITRVGHRRTYLVAIDSSFEDLVKILNLKLTNQDVDIEEVFTGEILDSKFTFVTKKGDIKSNIVIGPVKRDEIRVHVGTDRGNFNTENTIESWEENHPKVALFIEIDHYNLEDNEMNYCRRFLDESIKNTDEIAQKISDFILSGD